MATLLSVLTVIGVFIGVLLLVAAFTKKDYSVKRDIIIRKPVSHVFNYIKYLKNQDAFSVWARMDPNMKKEYRGTDGMPGFVSAWESPHKKVGKGEQKIETVRENDYIDTKLHFIKPFEGKADARMATEPVANDQTRVTWSISSRMNYPSNLFLLFMNMDKMMGKDLEGGLQQLKQNLESN